MLNGDLTLDRESEESDVPDDIGAIDAVVGFHIRLAYGAVYRHFMETFSDLGLTQKQVSVLWLIDDHPNIAQVDLGRRLQIDRATIMAIINRLQARGFIERGQSKYDGRKQTLHLTRNGQDILLKAQEAILAHEAWLKGRFTAREVATLIKLLKRVHE